MNDVFSKDYYRIFAGGRESLRQRLSRPVQLSYIKLLRQTAQSRGIPRLVNQLRLRGMSRRTQIQIPAQTSIGEGLYIGHCGRIIINPDARLGKNINIATGVTIGQENRGKRKGSPTIGDCVWIGTNAVIVGGITIGSDVLIAPLAFVNFNVPDHSIVLGNPAKIIPRDNATAGYIENPV